MEASPRPKPILTDKQGQWPRRGESHTLPHAQKGPMGSPRLRCLNPQRSQELLSEARPPFEPHMPLAVCSALTPRHLRPTGVTENIFSVESFEGVLDAEEEPAPQGSASPGELERRRDGGERGETHTPRSARGIGQTIRSARHSMPSWEPTGPLPVRIMAERRADRFKSAHSAVPCLPSEQLPTYYASPRGGERGRHGSPADGRHPSRASALSGSRGGDIASKPHRPPPATFIHKRVGFNGPGASDDSFRVTRARTAFYEDIKQLGAAASLSRLRPTGSGPQGEWMRFKQRLQEQREPQPSGGAPHSTQVPAAGGGQWPPQETVRFRRDTELGLLPDF